MLTRRLDLGFTRKAAAKLLKVNEGSLKNWEKGRTNPGGRFYPALIAFVGCNPIPAPKTLGEAVRRERLRRGLSQARLAALAHVDPTTISRLESDPPQAARGSTGAVFRILGLDTPSED